MPSAAPLTIIVSRRFLSMTSPSHLACITMFCGLISACSNSRPACSDADVLTTLQGLIDQRLTHILTAANPEASVRITPTGITTTQQTSNRSACQATMPVVLTRKTDGLSQTQQHPLTYIAERQDDGNVRVTAYGL